MIIKIPFYKIDTNKPSISVKNDEGEFDNAYIILTADVSNVEAAVSYAKQNAWVVGIEFSGNDFTKVNELAADDVNLFITFNAGDITPEALQNIEFGFTTVSEKLKVVINTSSSFCNMQTVKDICTRHPNASFSGGNFIRLDNCRFGSVWLENLPKPVKLSKLGVLANGTCEPFKMVDSEIVDYVFGDDICIRIKGTEKKTRKTSTTSKTPKEPKAAKAQKKSRFDFASAGGLGAF